jgi:hypothetical protein
MTRRVLHVRGDAVSVSEESRFVTEEDLERAVAAHPEVLPAEDFGLGPLIALGTQLDFLLAARREYLTELLAGWSPERHAEIGRQLGLLAQDLAEQAPASEPATA